MTNEELTNKLNSETGLKGSDAVTVNVIRQWVGWGVLPRAIPAATAIGAAPKWRRTDRSLRRARRLAMLRKSGIRRESGVIAQAYLEWGHPDSDRARDAILTEYRRSRAQLMKDITSDTSFKDFSEVSAVRIRALRKQSGPLDARFGNTKLEQSDEFYLSLLDWMRSGGHERDALAALLREAVDRFLPGLSADVIAGPINFAVSAACALFGTPGEAANPGESSLINASNSELRNARRELRRFVRLSRFAFIIAKSVELGADQRLLIDTLVELEPQIVTGKWALAAFVGTLHARRRPRLDESH